MVYVKWRFFMNLQDLNYKLKEMNQIPYPEVKDIQPDYQFGRLLYDSYAGSKSELTTILTYEFQDFTNRDKEELGNVLSAIAKQEMRHLKLLGEILVSLGLDPYYMNTYGKRWCSDNVRTNYGSLQELLDFNIESEKEAISEYKRLIDVCKYDNIKDVLARIIMDEENHVQIFEMLKEQYADYDK